MVIYRMSPRVDEWIVLSNIYMVDYCSAVVCKKMQCLMMPQVLVTEGMKCKTSFKHKFGLAVFSLFFRTYLAAVTCTFDQPE